MARFYTDEHFPKIVSQLLRDLGHDVLTCQEAKQASLGIPDADVLAFATNQNRAVLTFNRDDFVKLHRFNSAHAGIIVCSNDSNRQQLANRINEAVCKETSLKTKLIRVNRPSR